MIRFSGLGPVDQDPDEVRGMACRLLGVPCTDATTPPPTSPPTTGSVSLPFGWLVVSVLGAVLVVALVVLVIHLVRTLRGRRATDEHTEPEFTVESATVIDTSREPRQWRDEADRHAASGRYRDAIRCRYRALVGDLARRGVLDEIPGRTTGEERAQVAATGVVAAGPFGAATRLFDDAWYGDRQVGAHDHQRFMMWEREILEPVAVSSAGPG